MISIYSEITINILEKGKHGQFKFREKLEVFKKENCAIKQKRFVITIEEFPQRLLAKAVKMKRYEWLKNITIQAESTYKNKSETVVLGSKWRLRGK